MKKAKYNKSLHVLVTEEQHKKISNLSKKTGYSIGEIVRELIDAGNGVIQYDAHGAIKVKK